MSSSLNLHPFELQPSMFELRKGEAFVLECVFKPPDDRPFEQEMIIVCDNCSTLEFKLIGHGQLARVEYVELENKIDNQTTSDEITEDTVLIDEFKDVSSSKIIRFPSLNPNVFERKKFAIRNIS